MWQAICWHDVRKKISDLLAAGPTLSFEFFPPATATAEARLNETLGNLASLKPSFVSVTCGAGGDNHNRTRDVVMGICREHPFPAMAHLTCVGHTRCAIGPLLDEYASAGVINILALAGDPPESGVIGGGFHYASELVDVIREHPAGFSVGVAAHPEVHPRSTDRASDRRHLAAKLSHADFAVTQFFFDSADYVKLCEELAMLGCDRPVIPGVMPVIQPGSVRRFAAMNGSRVPQLLFERLESLSKTDRVQGSCRRRSLNDPGAVRRQVLQASTYTRLTSRKYHCGSPPQACCHTGLLPARRRSGSRPLPPARRMITCNTCRSRASVLSWFGCGLGLLVWGGMFTKCELSDGDRSELERLKRSVDASPTAFTQEADKFAACGRGDLGCSCSRSDNAVMQCRNGLA